MLLSHNSLSKCWLLRAGPPQTRPTGEVPAEGPSFALRGLNLLGLIPSALLILEERPLMGFTGKPEPDSELPLVLILYVCSLVHSFTCDCLLSSRCVSSTIRGVGVHTWTLALGVLRESLWDRSILSPFLPSPVPQEAEPC